MSPRTSSSSPAEVPPWTVRTRRKACRLNRGDRLRQEAGERPTTSISVVDLTRQLSNLRLEVQRLVATTSVARASEPHSDDCEAKPAGRARQSATMASADMWAAVHERSARIFPIEPV